LNIFQQKQYEELKKKQQSGQLEPPKAPSKQKAQTEQKSAASQKTLPINRQSSTKTSDPIRENFLRKPSSSQTQEQKWYKGGKPTEVETLAKIATETEKNREFGQELYGYYEQAKQEGAWAETYDKATSRYAAALGLPEGTTINDEFFEQMKPYFAAGVTTDAGNLSTAKKNGADALFAANLAGLYDDYQKTKTLKNESDNMFKEIQYWVGQGLTDDEIRKKVDIASNKSYSTLRKAMEKTATGEYEPTTEAIPALTSYGVDGMIWAARNPGKSTGDYKLDAVQGAMGRGVQHTSTPEDIARRTPGSDSWAPYASGTTMHDAAIMFGVGKGFAPDWIDKNAPAIIASGDETAQAMLAKIDSAEKFTRQAEAELVSLNRSIETAISADPTADPDDIIERVFGSADSPAYAALAEMDNTFRTGKVLNTTRGVGYDRKAIEADIRARSAEAQKKEAALTDPTVMNEVVSEQKSAAVQENGGTLLTPGKVEESVPDEAKVSILYGSGLDPEQIQQGFDKIAAWISSRVEKNRKKRAEKIQKEQEAEAAEAEKKMEYSETITGPSASADTPEPIAVIASAGASDVSTKAPSAPILSREELAAAQEEIYALEAEGRYEEAAKAQFPLIISAVTNSEDAYVKELVTSVGAQEAAVHLTSLILQGDMLNQVDDLDVWDTVADYEYYICKVLDIDTASADMIAQAMDFVTGGAYSQTEDNAGVGVLRTVESTAVQGMAKANDLWANIAGAVMTGYGHVVKGTNDLINNTLGKLFDFEIQDTLADKTIESGQNLATHYDKIQANEDAVMREYATPMEYFTASAGSEAVKMGVQSVAGSAVVGKVVPSVTQVMTGKDGLKTLQTAMDLVKIEGLTSKVAAATPFIADSMASEYNATYAETKNPVTALLTSVVSGFATTAIMNVDAIKNIESMGKLIPEVVDTLKAVPGVGMLANAKRYGKMGMMYIGNMFKTAANEAIQEPTESLLKTWVTDTLKGKDFFEDRDWKAFGAELASDAFYAAIGTFGNTMASLPSWSRSATYANQMMGKTGLTAQEVVGQIDAFIEDMNDPQVVAQLEANLNEAAVEARTGELVSEGGLAPVDTSAVTTAEQKVAEAEEVLVDAEIALTQATAESDAALAKFQENPSDENTKRLSAAIAAENKAKKDQEKASAGLQKAQTALGEAQSAVQAQSEAAIGAARAQAQAEVQTATDSVTAKRAEQEAESVKGPKPDSASYAPVEGTAPSAKPATASNTEIYPEQAIATTPTLEAAEKVQTSVDAPILAPLKGQGVSQFAAQTGQNTPVLSDAVKEELRKSPYYQKTSQQGNVDKAIEAVDRYGYDTRKNMVLDGTTNLFTPEGQAEAFVLVRAAKEAGDTAGEAALAFKIKESGTLLGQSLAMRQLYVNMTPEGKQQFVQRFVDQINSEYERQKKDTRVVAPDWLADKLKAAEGDDEATSKVLDEAFVAIAQQMPPDWKTRLNAWRYTAMLANPRTHIRNFTGNAVMMPVVAAKNKLGALMELSVDKNKRTKSLAPVKAEYKEYAKKQLKSVTDLLTGGGKHSPMDVIQENRRDFDSRILNWLSKGNGKLLNAEDTIFLNHHFINAFAGFMQARGVDVNHVDNATLSAGLDYAIGEAQKATYRDASDIASKISKFSRDLNNSDKKSTQAAGILLEGALPFKKTPINVMKRGIEYSPVGLLSTLATWKHDVKTGKATQVEVFDRLASGLTGTALAVVGGWLWNMGALKLSMDDPEDELEKLQGSQEYSIELFDTSVTIDWLSPSAMPLFVGGAIAELMAGKGEGELNLNTFADAMMNIAEPVFNLSMLDGVNTLLSAASYSDNGVVDLMMKMAESYVSQFVPSAFGAAARTIDDTRRTTYTDKNSGAPSTLQYLSDSTLNKIPWLSRVGQPYMNAWGEEDVTESLGQRAFENLVSPGYINSLDKDGVEQHLMELFDETSETGLIPKSPQKYFTVNKERYDLSGEQYAQLTKERGQKAKGLHEQLFAMPEFMELPAKYQAEAVAYVWDYATTTAKHTINNDVEVSSWMKAKDIAAEIMSKVNANIDSDKKDAFREELYSAIGSDDTENAATCVAGLLEMGVKKSSLKSSVTNQFKSSYKELYEAGDVGGMRDLEDSLIMLGLGYTQKDFDKWLD
jgi:hypothetical protein